MSNDLIPVSDEQAKELREFATKEYRTTGDDLRKMGL
jgi:hypothetical protein